jgi:hypothetical protein
VYTTKERLLPNVTIAIPFSIDMKKVNLLVVQYLILDKLIIKMKRNIISSKVEPQNTEDLWLNLNDSKVYSFEEGIWTDINWIPNRHFNLEIEYNVDNTVEYLSSLCDEGYTVEDFTSKLWDKFIKQNTINPICPNECIAIDLSLKKTGENISLDHVQGTFTGKLLGGNEDGSFSYQSSTSYFSSSLEIVELNYVIGDSGYLKEIPGYNPDSVYTVNIIGAPPYTDLYIATEDLNNKIATALFKINKDTYSESTISKFKPIEDLKAYGSICTLPKRLDVVLDATNNLQELLIDNSAGSSGYQELLKNVLLDTLDNRGYSYEDMDYLIQSIMTVYYNTTNPLVGHFYHKYTLSNTPLSTESANTTISIDNTKITLNKTTIKEMSFNYISDEVVFNNVKCYNKIIGSWNKSFNGTLIIPELDIKLSYSSSSAYISLYVNSNSRLILSTKYYSDINEQLVKLGHYEDRIYKKVIYKPEDTVQIYNFGFTPNIDCLSNIDTIYEVIFNDKIGIIYENQQLFLMEGSEFKSFYDLGYAYKLGEDSYITSVEQFNKLLEDYNLDGYNSITFSGTESHLLGTEKVQDVEKVLDVRLAVDAKISLDESGNVSDFTTDYDINQPVKFYPYFLKNV